jgi:O-antigen/teichoic acid export membrane protein
MGYSSKEKVARGVAWAGASNWGGQLLSFCAYTALARLLDPHAFGQVAIASVYLAFIQLIVTQGFGTAIIQRDDLQDEHLDSAFWIAMATAAFFCLLSLLLTRTIACLFHEPSVAPVIGWLSLSLFFYALSSIPTAILTRALNFRAIAVRSLAATGVGGMVGVAMAWLGWGVWSLVGQWLVGAVLASGGPFAGGLVSGSPNAICGICTDFRSTLP